MTHATQRPLVSVVTPSYNQAAFLENTIRSVLGQDYPAVEYLIVDGASQDGSQSILQKYSRQLAWWVSEPDSGQAVAINKGLRRARGEILAWLNSDDLYLPGAISAAVRVLQSNPAPGMVFGDALTIDASGRPLNQLRFGNWGLDELMGFRIICQPAVFMRRSTLEAAGLLDPSYHFMLDHHLWLRMARLAPVQHVPELWAAARYHLDAKNVAQASGFGKETMRILAWMETQPDLAARLAAGRKRILSGAHRLNARYLLDGDQPGPALQEYGRALLANPRFALAHWHRMLFAVFSLLGFKNLAGLYYRLQEKRRPALGNLPELQNWPGLSIETNAPKNQAAA